MRLFVGVELDDPLRTACAAAARDLQDRIHDARARLAIRWIPEHNLHVTVWFLGAVSDGNVPAVVDAVRSEWETGAFTLTVSGAGVFPPAGPPRIVWLGITGGADRLTGVYRELTLRLAPLGFEPERRPYHPHITVGRAKEIGRAGSKARRLIESASVHPGSCGVRSVTVFESRLSPAGARYEPLLRVPLKEC